MLQQQQQQLFSTTRTRSCFIALVESTMNLLFAGGSSEHYPSPCIMLLLLGLSSAGWLDGWMAECGADDEHNCCPCQRPRQDDAAAARAQKETSTKLQDFGWHTCLHCVASAAPAVAQAAAAAAAASALGHKAAPLLLLLAAPLCAL